MPDEEIGGNTLVRVFSVVLKYTFREDISEKLVLITMTLRELMSWQDGMSLVATFLRYLAMSGARISREELRKAVKKALPKEGERIMSSIAQEWFEEGRQQGMLRGIEQGVQRGIEQGVLEGLHKSIALGLELKFAADGLRLLPEIRKIADRDVLEAIYEGIKTVNSTADLRRIYKRRRRG